MIAVELCLVLALLQAAKVLSLNCPTWQKYGTGPPSSCSDPTDPLKKPASKLESWFTKDMFNDLFPKANIGWGPNKCWPYSYEAFVIAARYFPQFGTEAPNNSYTAEQNYKRDVAAFISHNIQETGENDISVYTGRSQADADACFYRGGFFNWFEGGPVSSFLPASSPGYQPKDGNQCSAAGLYCSEDAQSKVLWPCNKAKSGAYFIGCYLGRGAIQISYNYNYGQFQDWLKKQGIVADLLTNPNLVMTKMDPPLAVMASLWFYMTPQPPKPAMHDIVMGSWEPGAQNKAVGYKGPIFGPTNLIINNECNGEDVATPGGAGESRRIKAFKWLTKTYFKVPTGDDKLLTCKNMVQKLDMIQHNVSWQPNWQTTWKAEKCDCAPASYQGFIPYFQAGYYPQRFVDQNEANRKACQAMLYKNPSLFGLPLDSECLKH